MSVQPSFMPSSANTASEVPSKVHSSVVGPAESLCQQPPKPLESMSLSELFEECDKEYAKFKKDAAELHRDLTRANRECGEAYARCQAAAAEAEKNFEQAKRVCNEAFGALAAATVVLAVVGDSPTVNRPHRQHRGDGNGQHPPPALQ